MTSTHHSSAQQDGEPIILYVEDISYGIVSSPMSFYSSFTVQLCSCPIIHFRIN